MADTNHGLGFVAGCIYITHQMTAGVPKSSLERKPHLRSYLASGVLVADPVDIDCCRNDTNIFPWCIELEIDTQGLDLGRSN
jgi:hypothetical protein